MKNKKLRRVLRLLLLAMGGLVGLVLVAGLVVSFFAIPIDLTDYKGLVVAPTAKRPEYFGLATPLVVKGDFDDFRVGLKRGALAKTGFKFIFSPITTSVKRLVKEDLPEDGNDICGLPIGPRDGEIAKLPGC
jgi:hypothetical protein